MRSDKMQMSYVPQVTEHIHITGVAANTATTPEQYDITVPPECIIEKVVVMVVSKFNTTNVAATMKIGSTADDDLFTPGGTINLTTANNNFAIVPTKYMTPVASLAADRIVRFSVMNSHASAVESGKSVYAYVQYRFPSNGIPTRIA